MAIRSDFIINLGVIGKDRVQYLSSEVRKLGRELGTIPDRNRAIQQSVVAWSSLQQAISNTYSGIQQITGVMQQYIDKSNAATESQTKLQTIMHQRMNASEQDVKSINDMIAAQTKLGVVGGTVQRSGMQQLATFASQKSTLEMLLPAMNNLLVQQNGLNSTSEAAVGVANLMGKALMGNVGALTRVGITLTDHQKELIKTGDEYTRANTLAEAITQNVGNMNKKMADTDAGRAKKAANDIASLQVQLGEFFSQYQGAIMVIGQAGAAVAGLGSLAAGIMAVARATGLATLATNAWGVAQATFATAGKFLIAIINGETMSLAAFRAGIRSTILSLGIIGVAVFALNEVFAAVTEKLGLFGSAEEDAAAKTNNLTEAQRRQQEEAQRLAQRGKDTGETLGRATDNLVGKYKNLQAQWKALKTTHEKNQWIKKNQSAFGELGISVNNVNDAYNYFVKNSSKVVAALKAIAEARAWQEIYQKDMENLHQKERETNTVEGGGYYVKAHKGDLVAAPMTVSADGTATEKALKARGFVKGRDYVVTNTGHGTVNYEATDSGAAILNRERAAAATSKRNKTLDPYRGYVSESEQKMVDAQTKAQEAAREANVDMNGNSLGNVSTNTPSGRTTGGRTGRGMTSTPADKPLTWIENPKERADYEQNSKYLQQEIDKLDAANGADAARIKTLQEKKAVVDEIIDKYNELERVEAQKPQDDKVAGADKFETGSLADYEAQLQRVNDDLRNRNVSGMELLSLLRQQAALQSTVNRMQSQRGQGQPDEEANPYDAQIEALRQERDRIYDMFDDDIELDVDIKLQGDIDKIDKQLGDLIRKKRQWDRRNRRKPDNGGWESTTEQIEKLGSAAQNMGNAFSQMGGDTAAAVMQVVAATASATAEIIPQIMTLIGAKEGEALASGTASAAEVPFPGNIAAIAAIVASIMGVIATIGSVTGGFATGGIVPGTSYRGDKLTARVNSGEMILTARQQARLFQIADGSLLPRVAYPPVGIAGSPSVNTSGFAGGGMLPADKILFRLKGRDVVAMIANETRVGGKIGRRSNIKI